MFGITTSLSTRSNSLDSMSSRPSAPSQAVWTSQPSASRISSRLRQMPGSSSTTRMRSPASRERIADSGRRSRRSSMRPGPTYSTVSY